MQRLPIGRLIIAMASLLATTSYAATVNLAWDYTQNPDHLAIGFIVERCTGAGCTTFTVLPSMPIPVTQKTYSDTALVNGQTYQWRVLAVDAAGLKSTYTNIVTMQTPVAPVLPPTNLTGTLVP